MSLYGFGQFSYDAINLLKIYQFKYLTNLRVNVLQIRTESRLESDLSTIILRLLKQSFVTAVQGNFKSCIAKEIEEGDSPSWMFQGNARRLDGVKRQKLQFQGVDFQVHNHDA